MEEQWKEIPRTNGTYQISSFGRVKSLKQSSPRILKPQGQTSTRKYKKYSLSMGARKKYRYITAHTEVAKAFIPNPKKFPVVHHIDNDPENNRVDNLKWCTYSDNTNFAIKDGTFTQVYKKGESHKMSKLSDSQIEFARALYSKGVLQKYIAVILNCSRAYVSELVNFKKRS